MYRSCIIGSRFFFVLEDLALYQCVSSNVHLHSSKRSSQLDLSRCNRYLTSSGRRVTPYVFADVSSSLSSRHPVKLFDPFVEQEVESVSAGVFLHKSTSR